MTPISWDDARAAVHAVATPLRGRAVPLLEADGAVLATPLVTLSAGPKWSEPLFEADNRPVVRLHQSGVGGQQRIP